MMDVCNEHGRISYVEYFELLYISPISCQLVHEAGKFIFSSSLRISSDQYRRNQSIEAFGVGMGIYLSDAVLGISRVRYTIYTVHIQFQVIRVRTLLV